LAVASCVEKIKTGTELSVLLKQYPKLFAAIVANMIAVGERTGNIEQLLKELAAFYNEDVSNTMKNITTIIEPITILFLGVIVAGMALAVIMPMFALTQNI
jgi:type IV pilus assembly protein PilC